MTREEAYEQFGAVMIQMNDGRVTFHHDNPASKVVRVTCDNYEIYTNTDIPGWINLGLLKLINTVISDLKRKLKECEIEEPALQERALRKVNIGRDSARTA